MRYAIVPDQNNALRLAIVIAVTGLALLAMGIVFWRQDLRYSQPTERPQDLVQAPVGTVMELPAALSSVPDLLPNKPLLLHFYNPDCPCSRFNLDHLQLLQARYGPRVQFVEIVESATVGDSGLGLPVVADPDGSLAAHFGVYSTPQAVVLDATRRLHYRGNFNAARYCNTPATQFARQALEALLNGTATVFDPRAEAAFGCPLPGEEDRGPVR